MNLQRSLLASITALFVSLALAGSALAQDRGTVTGTVTDATSGAPLVGAQVVVDGTTIGGLTNASGRYLIQNVPVGAQQVRAILLGYGPITQAVTITAGETAVLDFQLSLSAIALDEVVVTATGEQRKREIGHAIGTISAAEVVESAPINNVSDLISGRSAGVQVVAPSGTAGMGSRIRIRGSSSISLGNGPLLYVDGVRVNSGAGISLNAVGGQEPSRFDDINPEDIESIEIIKGPAAATLYGTEAANGVIRITTKTGRAGATRWNVWVEGGLVQEKNQYPLNFAGVDADNVDGFDELCLLEFQNDGLCQQDRISTYQVLDDPNLTPFDDGSRQQYGISVTGGSDNINYYASLEYEGEDGPYSLPQRDRDDLTDRGINITDKMERPVQLDRINMRANLNAQLAENANIGVRVGYLTSNLSFTGNDNNSFGFLPSAYFGGAFPDRPDEAWGFQEPAQLFGRDLLQDVERFTGSLTAGWNPLQWLETRGTFGLDFSSRQDLSFFPRDIGVPGQRNLGWRDRNFRDLFQYTVDVGASANFDLQDNIVSRTSVGAQYFRNVFSGTDAWGVDIVNGAASIGVAAETFSWETTAEDKTLGVFIEQQISLNDRLFVTGAVRADDNSAFGTDFDLIYYPKASISWIASEEDFFPELSFLDQLRVRGAWGRSGLQPGSDDAIRTLSADPITDPSDATISGVSIGEVGNALLEPEQSEEIELGLDADMFGGRLGFELTYYDKDTQDALVQVPLPPSLGASNSQWRNVGEVENKGWEAAVNALVVNTDNYQWDMTVTASTNKNTLITLGTEPIGSSTRFVEGFPLGSQWAFPYTFSDGDGNGIITSDELVIGDSLTFAGNGLPEDMLSINSSVTLFNRVRLYGLLDYRGDYISYNLTEAFRCRFLLCAGLIDPSASQVNQARAAAQVFHPNQTEWGYLEDASFWKLREVSATLFIPDEWATRFRASRATLTLTGRNLKTWTDYSGLDPEVNDNGSADNFGTRDFLTQPPLRYWTLRVNLSF